MDRRLGYGLIGAAALGGVVAALPFVVPAGIYKERIERAVSDAAGRKFTIAGPLRFTLFPTLGLTAERAALANLPGRAGAFATAEAVHVGLRLVPLLRGRIEVSEIVLERPMIALEVDRDGRANWIFVRRRPSRPGGGTPASVTPHFSGLRIAHGFVRYGNARRGDARSVDDLDATVDMTELDRPAGAEGTFVYAGRPVRFALRVPVPRALLDGRTAALDLSLNAAPMRLRFQGAAAPDGDAQGRLTMDMPSLRRAGEWLGAKLPSGGGLGALSLSGAIRSSGRIVALTELNIRLDGAAIGGALTLDTSGKIPDVAGRLRVDRLDLNPYLHAPPRSGPPGPARRRDGGWSREKVALDALRRIDARVVLDAASLKIKSLTLGRTRIDVALRDGRLRALLGPMALYGGSGKAELDVDAHAPVPGFHNAATFTDVALQPFLRDTIGVGQIAGTGTIALDVTAQGTSADAIMHRLGGRGSIAFRDGRLDGVDLGAVARTVQALIGAAGAGGAFTDYAAMSGSFRIANGVLASDDFQLAGPLIRTAGSGTVDIGRRAIDFRIVPRATASVARIKLSVGVPFRIRGPWGHMRYDADLSGVGAALENLFRPKPESGAPKKKHKSVGEALKNMLGIH